MKTVISAAGNLKRENPDMNEVWKKIKSKRPCQDSNLESSDP